VELSEADDKQKSLVCGDEKGLMRYIYCFMLCYVMLWCDLVYG
jgi:hypothetical protein